MPRRSCCNIHQRLISIGDFNSLTALIRFMEFSRRLVSRTHQQKKAEKTTRMRSGCWHTESILVLFLIGAKPSPMNWKQSIGDCPNTVSKSRPARQKRRTSIIGTSVVSQFLLIPVIGKFQFIQHKESQSHNHTDHAGQNHTGQLYTSELYGNSG